MSENVYSPCKYCGASHGMGVEEMATGKITPIDICYKCLWEPWRDHFKPLTEQVVLHEELSATTCPIIGDIFVNIFARLGDCLNETERKIIEEMKNE